MGYWRRKIRLSDPAAQNAEPLFSAVRPYFSWTPKRTLFAGNAAPGQAPLLRVGVPNEVLLPVCGWYRPMAVTAGDTGQSVVVLEATAFRGERYGFAFAGREFKWSTRTFWSKQARYVLEERMPGGALSFVAELLCGDLARQAKLRMWRADSGLPLELILATGLAMEALVEVPQKSYR